MTNLKIIKVAGSQAYRSNFPENVLDTSNDTFFISQGANAKLDVELEKAEKFDTVAVAFSEGKTRKTKFSVQTTKDFSNFDNIGNFISSGATEAPEEYSFKPVTAKGIRLQFLGNIDNIGAGNLNEDNTGITSTQSTQVAISQIAADNYNAMNIASNSSTGGGNPNGTVNSVSADNAAAGNISANASILAGMNVEEQNQLPTNASAGVTDAGANQIKQSADLSKQFFSISRVTIANRNLKPQEIETRQSGLSETAVDDKTRKQAAAGEFKRGSLGADVDHNVSQDRNINTEVGGTVAGGQQQKQSARHGDTCAVCGNAVDQTAICKVCGNNTITNDQQSTPQGTKDQSDKAKQGKSDNAGRNNKSSSKSSRSTQKTSESESNSDGDNDETIIVGQNQAAKDNTTTKVPEGSNSNNKQNIKIEGQLENQDKSTETNNKDNNEVV